MSICQELLFVNRNPRIGIVKRLAMRLFTVVALWSNPADAKAACVAPSPQLAVMGQPPAQKNSPTIHISRSALSSELLTDKADTQEGQ
jgi:hypothetical protein